MPTYLFYPRRADGVSLTFIAEVAGSDVEALGLAAEIAEAHDCVGVFVWEPSGQDGKDRFVGHADRQGLAAAHGKTAREGGKPIPETPARA
jgi:hypothetical protein